MIVAGPLVPHLRRVRAVRWTGIVVAVLSLLGLIAGLIVAGSLANDYRATVSVSRSAIQAIGDTVEAVDDIAAATGESMASAARSIDGASATLDQAVLALEEVAAFLEDDLPADLESVRTAMPAAIQAADAIDGTLRALTLFGVDYDPEEPFGESLTRIDTALAGLSEEIRVQADALRALIPSATGLADETEQLSRSVDELSAGVSRLTGLADGYQETVDEAEATIERTGDSVESRIWLLRLMIVAFGVAGIGVGLALVMVAAALAGAPVATRPALVEAVD